MRPVQVSYDGIVAELCGGWVISCAPDADHVPLRMDDGSSGICIVDDRISPGDRVYRTVYRGHHLEGHVGVDVADVTADLVQTACRTRRAPVSRVYLAMTAVPAFLLLLMLVLRAVAGIPAAVVVSLAVAMAIPLAMGLADARGRRRLNRRRASALKGCRHLVENAIRQDVAIWKERIIGAVPVPGGSIGNVVVRGTSCRVVEGTYDIGPGGPRMLRQGRPLSLPIGAVDACRLEDGDVVHAIVTSGTVPAMPLAVGDPLSGKTWTSDAVAGGPDGQPHRELMRAVLGRAAWSLVTRQWDEVGRRRSARRA